MLFWFWFWFYNTLPAAHWLAHLNGKLYKTEKTTDYTEYLYQLGETTKKA